jgi:hypothetical protein
VSSTVACLSVEAPLLFRVTIPSVARAVPARRLVPAVVVLALLPACGDNTGDSSNLPARPELLEPSSGQRLDTDTPTFVVRNAAGYDEGEATYTFNITIASTNRFVASYAVNASKGQTRAVFPYPLLRGATLAWRVVARNSSGNEVASDNSTFRLPAVQCGNSRDPYAKAVTESWIPSCSLAQNAYNNPQEALGPPNAAGNAVTGFRGFVSLGDGGYVSLDVQACAQDVPGPDVRVYQAVSQEPVSLYVSSTGTGPWVLVDARISCGIRVTPQIGYCDFDLADSGVEEARYFKVEDGELFPCPGGTNSEGADLDALQILNVKP